ncbi:MAG: ABC transporter substrate-binding protein [Pseudomonadota bacterium]
MNRTRRQAVLAFAIGVGALMSAQLGAGPALAEPEPQRIVVAGGDLTEIVFALGAGDRVVGVDSTSTWPAAATEREQIGYVRRLSPEGILSLSPDLVIAAHDAGPDIALEQLEAAGVKIAQAPQAETAEAIERKIAFVGEALGLGEKASVLAEDFSSSLSTVKDKVAKLDGTPRVLFILSVRNGAPLIGGAGTTADEMIALAGGVNAGGEVDGYKPMNQEAIIAAAPDIVLMMAQHAERIGGLESVMTRPEIALTPAGQEGNGVVMDGMLLLGFGPRTPDAIAELARALHPESAAAAGL